MLQTILNSFGVREIRMKLAFTAAMLALYRLGAYIPAPGVDVDAVKDIESELLRATTSSAFLNLFSGGSLSRLSLFALGIMPYITASIILQLMTVVVPSLERLQKEGEVGQQKITQYTRYLTVALAFAQSLGYVFLFQSFQDQAATSVVGHPDRSPKLILIVIALTAGTHAADVARRADHPARDRQRHLADDLRLDRLRASRAGIQAWWTNPDQVFVVMMPFIALAVIVGIVFVQEGQRRIPVQYAKRVVGRRMTTGGSDLPAAARQHGRRDPGHLRRLDHGLPADHRPASQHARPRSTSPPSSARTAGPTSSARSSSSSSSPTSTRRSPSTRSTRPTT